MKDNQQLQIFDLEELTVALSDEELETIVGGFNPQPDPPGDNPILAFPSVKPILSLYSSYRV